MADSNQTPVSKKPQSTQVIQHFGEWTSDEKAIFQEGVILYGKDYGKLTELVKTRNVTQVRSHYQKYATRQENLKNKIGYQPVQEGTLTDLPQTRSKTRRHNPEPPRNIQNNETIQHAPMEQIPEIPMPIPEIPIAIPEITITGFIVPMHIPLPIDRNFKPIVLKSAMEVQISENQLQPNASPLPISSVFNSSRNSAFRSFKTQKSSKIPKSTHKIKKAPKPNADGKEKQEQDQ